MPVQHALEHRLYRLFEAGLRLRVVAPPVALRLLTLPAQRPLVGGGGWGLVGWLVWGVVLVKGWGYVDQREGESRQKGLAQLLATQPAAAAGAAPVLDPYNHRSSNAAKTNITQPP